MCGFFYRGLDTRSGDNVKGAVFFGRTRPSSVLTILVDHRRHEFAGLLGGKHLIAGGIAFIDHIKHVRPCISGAIKQRTDIGEHDLLGIEVQGDDFDNLDFVLLANAFVADQRERGDEGEGVTEHLLAQITFHHHGLIRQNAQGVPIAQCALGDANGRIGGVTAPYGTALDKMPLKTPHGLQAVIKGENFIPLLDSVDFAPTETRGHLGPGNETRADRSPWRATALAELPRTMQPMCIADRLFAEYLTELHLFIPLFGLCGWQPVRIW